ncbi:hypothetical protein FOBRF1_011623 [Fusarium oxysporum]
MALKTNLVILADAFVRGILTIIEFALLLALSLGIMFASAYFAWFVHQHLQPAMDGDADLFKTKEAFFYFSFLTIYSTVVVWGALPYYSVRKELPMQARSCLAGMFFLFSTASAQCRSLIQEIHSELEAAVNPAAKLPEESVIHVKTTKASAKARRMNRPSTRTSPRRSEVLVAPIPEQIYLAYCHMSKSWFAVLVLHIKWIESYGLHESIPACFHCNDEGHFIWKQGYEDGGPLISGRQFPVMFFGGASTFEQERYGWVAAKDLQKFDPQGYQASLVPHYNAVLAFIAERNCPSPGNVARELDEVAEAEITGPTLTDIEPLAATSSCSAGAQEIGTRRDLNPNVPGRISCEQREVASAAMELLTKSTSIYLTQPTSASSENSPTFYNLPPLNPAPAGNIKSLPTIRLLTDRISMNGHSGESSLKRDVPGI